MLSSYRHIVLLTGAGISQGAGLPTYRGPGGLWTAQRARELADVSALQTNRAEACAMFWDLALASRRASPSRAHVALADFQSRLPPDASFTLITQNVDGLHQRAGSRDVCEIHGSLARWTCERCGHTLDAPDAPPSHCDELMRPVATLFGEDLPLDALWQAKRALRDCDLFVAIGTSGSVEPAASFVRWAELNHARRILLNLDAFTGAAELFTDVDLGSADDLVPRWFQ
ncbi:MAG TPA: Sir2 family NAD-dependent protein deacetylase [Kofleriaceae bacterium]